jgi:hypothetical protein
LSAIKSHCRKVGPFRHARDLRLSVELAFVPTAPRGHFDAKPANWSTITLMVFLSSRTTLHVDRISDKSPDATAVTSAMLRTCR